jgi:hypothetical protein
MLAKPLVADGTSKYEAACTDDTANRCRDHTPNLCNAGYSVWSFDNQGHGLSDGYCGIRCGQKGFGLSGLSELLGVPPVNEQECLHLRSCSAAFLAVQIRCPRCPSNREMHVPLVCCAEASCVGLTTTWMMQPRCCRRQQQLTLVRAQSYASPCCDSRALHVVQDTCNSQCKSCFR